MPLIIASLGCAARPPMPPMAISIEGNPPGVVGVKQRGLRAGEGSSRSRPGASRSSGSATMGEKKRAEEEAVRGVVGESGPEEEYDDEADDMGGGEGPVDPVRYAISRSRLLGVCHGRLMRLYALYRLPSLPW